MSEEILSAEELAQIRARVEAATPGPWEVPASDEAPRIMGPPDEEGLRWQIAGGVWMDFEGGITSSEEDAAFIAAARTDIPALLATVDALREIVDAVAICDFVTTDDDGSLYCKFLCAGQQTVSDAGTDLYEHAPDCPSAKAFRLSHHMLHGKGPRP